MKERFLLLLLLIFASAQGQTYLMQNGTFATCSGTFYDSGGASGNYSANEDYEITFCPATPGSYISLQFSAFNIELSNNNLRDYMTIYNGVGTSGTIIANYYNSSPLNCSGGRIVSSDPSGCITVVFSSNNNNNQAGWEATISCSPTPGNTNAPTNSVCSGANPFCADSGLQYPNLSDCDAVPDAPQVVTDNTCLNTAPNPAWYYLSIGIAGVIDLEIKQSTGPNNTGTLLDVDFAIWGPFPDPVSACNDFTLGDCNGDHNCSGNVIDCSYDPAGIENATIPNAQVGEVYMVLITNFDGAPGFITMEQTNAGQAGAGSTDCSIVCPTFIGTNPTCGGSNGSIRVNGLGANQTHQVTYLDDGVPVTISLTANASGQATISGLNAGSYTQLLTDIAGCTNPSTVTLTSSIPTITAVTATSPVCSGSQVVFTITGTANSNVTYNINSGANQTVTLNASGIRNVTVNNVTSTTTLTTVSVATGATCTIPLVLSKTVTLKPASTLVLTTAAATANQTVCENLPITIIKYTVGGSATGATVTGLPNGVTSTFASSVLTINGSPSQTGTFNYVVTTSGGCAPDATMNGTINVSVLPSATISYPSTPYCKSLTTAQGVLRTGTGGGTYSATPAGLSIDLNTGAINPSASIAGNYNVTYTMAASGGCPAQTATTPVTITAIPTATISYATPFCNSLTTAQAVTRTGTAGGTYSATPTGLTLNATTGAIIPSTSFSGPYIVTYTMAAAAGCAAQTTTTNVVVTTLPSATISYPSTPYCKSLTTAQGVLRTGTGGGTYSATPAGLSIDVNTGAINPSTSIAGNYNVTYTMAASGGCPAQTATTPVTITAIPTATISYATPFCNSLTTAQAVTRTGTAGGTYSATPAGLTLNATTGAIIPSTSLSGPYIVTYTMAAAAGCAAQTTTTNVAVTTLPSTTISYPSTPYCKSLTTAQGVLRTGTGGGTYSASPAGLTINAATGAITPSTSIAGNYNVTYTMAAAGGCPAQTATTPVTITEIPSATIAYPSASYCNSEAIILNVRLTGTQGGTFSSIPSGLNINPSTGAIVPNASSSGSYQVVYTMPAAAGCAAQTTSTNIVIKALPMATASSQIVPICSGDTFSVNLSSSLPNTTFSWVRLASNVNGSNAGSGNVLSETLTTVNSSPGTVYYTITPNSDGCDGLPIVVTVQVNPLPEPQLVDGVICLNNLTNTLTRPFTLNTHLNDVMYDFVWSYNTAVIPNATSSTYQATQAGTYEVVATNSFTGCVSNPVQAQVTASYAAQTMSTSGYDAFTDNPMVIVNVNGPGTYMYQLDHGPIQYSNVFYNVPSGVHTVYVVDEEGCTQLSEEILVISYPKFFTPNSDGYNDTWNIDDLANQKQSVIYIFDRYGKLLKQISPSGKGWDGTYNGYQLPSTDYWFTVDYIENNTSKVFKAHFSLKR